MVIYVSFDCRVAISGRRSRLYGRDDAFLILRFSGNIVTKDNACLLISHPAHRCEIPVFRCSYSVFLSTLLKIESPDDLNSSDVSMRLKYYLQPKNTRTLVENNINRNISFG